MEFHLTDLTPRKEDVEKKSIQLPPISNQIFSCKHCFFTTNQQAKLDSHILTNHYPSKLQLMKKEVSEIVLSQSADGSVETSLDEHNSTNESNPHDASSVSANGVAAGQGHSKPFKCAECNYSTIYENCLKSHQARHSRDFEEILHSELLNEMKFESGYKCNICNNYTTAYKKCLASHLLKHKKGSSSKASRPRSLSNKSSNSRSSTAATSISDSMRRPTSGNSSVNCSDDDQCSSLLEATNRDLMIDEEREVLEDIRDVDEDVEDDDDDAPSSKRQNMRSSQDYMMDIDEHWQGASTPDSLPLSNACPFCETTFKLPKMLAIHMAFHGERDPFTCRSCGRVCRDSYEFQLHLIQFPH